MIANDWSSVLRRRAEDSMRRGAMEGDELALREVELAIQNEELMETKHRLERALSAQHQLVERAPFGYIETDIEGRIRRINRFGALLFGRTESELVGHEFAGLFDGHLPWAVHAHLQRARALGAAPVLDVAAHVAGVEIPLSLESVVLTEDEGGVVCATTVKDRSDTPVATREPVRSAAHAAESLLVAQVSHELRTPLSAMLGFAQLLGRLPEGEVLTARHRKMVDQILANGAQTRRLLDDLLDLARLEARPVSMALEPIGVDGVVSDVLASLAALASELGVQLVLPAPSHVRLLADAGRLRQILINLASNGVKHNVRGGSLTMSARTRLGVGRVEVKDTGPGIALEHRAHIFEPFYRVEGAEAARDGTGLGLAICRELVEAMHGRIGVECPAEGGSMFWIELPAA